MKRIKLLFFGLLVLPVIVSCDNEDAPLAGNAGSDITLGLSVAGRQVSGRASVSPGVLDAENYIIKGDYGIIMDLPKYGNQAHCCRFGVSDLDGGRRGNIYLVTDGNPGNSPLKWADVDVRSFDFTIDNIGYEEPCESDGNGFIGRVWDETDKTVTYAAQKEWYKASGEPGHTNDIIWGKGTARYGTDGKEVSYAELTHRMTRLRVAFLDLSEQQQDMTVSLTNIVLAPESFNRADGTVAVAADPVRGELQLLDSAKGEKLSVISDATAEGTYVEHVTDNFILPPQALTDDFWPELVVSYTDESGKPRTVRGLIPHDILNEDGNSWEALDGLNAGNHLTIVARIDDEIPDIVFTAKVRKWVDLGTMIVSAGQENEAPGINNLEELKHCISLYNELPQFKDLPNSWDASTFTQRQTNYGELMQYGNCRLNDSWCIEWTFKINFELDFDNLPEPLFRYMLCDLTKSVGAEKLGYYTYPLNFEYTPDPDKDISKQLKGPEGIYNIEDLNTFIKAVNESNAAFVVFLSTWKFVDNGTRLEFTVKVHDDISGDIISKINKERLEGLKYGEGKIPVTVIFDSNGHTLNGEANVGEQIGIQ